MEQKEEKNNNYCRSLEGALKKHRARLQMLTRVLVTMTLGVVVLSTVAFSLYRRQSWLVDHVLRLDSTLVHKHVELQELDNKADSLERLAHETEQGREEQ